MDLAQGNYRDSYSACYNALPSCSVTCTFWGVHVYYNHRYKCGYPSVFGNLGVLGDCVPDEDAIRVSRDISADVKRFCSHWYRGKADKVKKARPGP